MMTGQRILRSVSVLLLASVMMASGAVAQQAAPTKIAVINVQKVFVEAAAIHSIRSQIDKQIATYKKEITRQESELRAKQQELSRQKTLLDPEAYRERRGEVDRRLGRLERYSQNRKRVVERAFAAARTSVLKTLRDIVNEFAKEKGFTVVFRKSQFLFVSPQYDVTQEIVKRLDAKLPTVKVELPSE
jgi:Skp family chaperone for outer membrane proteins